MPLSVLICASCEVSSLFCNGLVGSWFFSCATNSVRKLLCRSDELLVPELLIDDEAELLLLVSLILATTDIGYLPYCPSVSVLSIMLFTVFSTSTFA